MFLFNLFVSDTEVTAPLISYDRNKELGEHMFVRKVKIVSYSWRWSLWLRVRTSFFGVKTAERSASKSGLWELKPGTSIEVNVNAPSTLCEVWLPKYCYLYIYGNLGIIKRDVWTAEQCREGDRCYVKVDTLLLL